MSTRPLESLETDHHSIPWNTPLRTPVYNGQFCLFRRRDHIFFVKLTRIIGLNGSSHCSESRVTNCQIVTTPLHGYCVSAFLCPFPLCQFFYLTARYTATMACPLGVRILTGFHCTSKYVSPCINNLYYINCSVLHGFLPPRNVVSEHT